MLNWLVNWDQKQQGVDEFDSAKFWKPDKALMEWLHNCLDVIWLLVEDNKCRVPFYELIRSGLQFIENIPDDEALFTLILEIHRRRDVMATHMQMLDQHLHCPTFEPSTFASGHYQHICIQLEEETSSIQRGSLDWERALRCLRHAFRNTPSPDWWRRVLLLSPCHRLHAQGPTPGAVFTSEMISEATIDRIRQIAGMSGLSFPMWRRPEKFFHSIKKTEVLTLITPKYIAGLHQQLSEFAYLVIKYINQRIFEQRAASKGKQIDEWWRQVSKGERIMDYMNMDERSIGMFWVVSYTMAQPACETVMHWLTSAGVTEILPGTNLQSNERLMVMQEVSPLPISLLSGFSINLCLKLAYQMEESMFSGQVVPSIAMVETYVRVLLIAPHALFRSLMTLLTQRNQNPLSKPAASILVFEILNYRLLSLYRYQGKNKGLIHDVTKIIATLKGKRGDHRAFRLAENLCMNLILSMREFFYVKRDAKGPTEFTETLNRITVTNLAIIIKTRGVAEVEHLLYLQTMLEQILATSKHAWSEKTLRYFPNILRDALAGRIAKRGLAIQAWQQAEQIVINQCTQLLSSSADPTYIMTYMNHSFLEHREYLCAGAWILMSGHPESINSLHLGRVLREFSPEEVTANIYTMVDVLLHHINLELQCGRPLQELILKACANLAFFIWTHELLPLDILLLALIDRDDDPHALRIVKSMSIGQDEAVYSGPMKLKRIESLILVQSLFPGQGTGGSGILLSCIEEFVEINILDSKELQQRVKLYLMNRGPPEHWLFSGTFKRAELQKALGNHLSWKERYPTFFDDIAARLLPVIPLIVYRLIENDAVDVADRVLQVYSTFLHYYPLNFTFVRDILAYFYGHLPGKLILRILNVLDVKKIPFSESFPQHINSSNASICPPLDYFATLLLGLVNHVIPPLNNSSKSGQVGETSSSSVRAPHNKAQVTSQAGPAIAPEGQKPFYQIQDPGTYTQLILETAVIEILSLPVTASQIVSSLVQIVVHIQPTLVQSSNGLQHPTGVGQNSVLPTSPSGGSTDSLGATRTPSASGLNTCNFIWRSGYTCQQLSCLLIQACGLLLAQLPPEFHIQLYIEAARVIKESWWLSDGKRSVSELESAVSYALLDPTWAAQDNTSTAIGNVVALLHSFFSNLPLEWLEGSHLIIKHLKPVTSIAGLRIAFRIMGPLLPDWPMLTPFSVRYGIILTDNFLNSLVPKLLQKRLLGIQTMPLTLTFLSKKILSLLLSVMVDVFGRNVQPSAPIEASEIADIIDFLHHIVHYEGQGGPVQASSKPRAEVLALIGRAAESLRPDVQHLLTHLKADVNSSIYAATHPKFVQNTN
ncbi:hypothetical protein DH2020_046277 [Rehmannia glutinosa]|uniref:Mediator of RNA polymerase II transcription subunit 23 n=1 Tax=Rehmannia glutinosa TaxID=99300 RepID=A0ABR0UBU3_REHGL